MKRLNGFAFLVGGASERLIAFQYRRPPNAPPIMASPTATEYTTSTVKSGMNFAKMTSPCGNDPRFPDHATIVSKITAGMRNNIGKYRGASSHRPMKIGTA